jgi:NitT/TauT family transport system ATP-binding protein
VNIAVRHISFGYGASFSPKKKTMQRKVPALIFHDFSLDINNEGSPLVFLGPSGCGKTTLLRLMAGLLKPTAGEIRIEGLSAPEGPSLSFVFQEPRLFPWLSVLENVKLPLLQTMEEAKAEKRASSCLERVFLADKASAYPHELSGGQQQRVSLARAFAYPAPLLFLDEPFQSLDIALRLKLMKTVLRLLQEESRILIMVTHEPREAIYLGCRIIVLGKPPRGIIFDELTSIPQQERGYASLASAHLEKKLLSFLTNEEF